MRKLPTPPKPWKDCDTRTASRVRHKRAKFRSMKDKEKYATFAEQVRSIRSALGKTRREFARMVGVSIITIKRWEFGMGYMPSSRRRRNKYGRVYLSNKERLAKLAKRVESLRKTKPK